MLTIDSPKLPLSFARLALGLAISALAALSPLAAWAGAETCHIVGISDGDTLQARCADGMVKIRLAEIDAPEKGQPFGMASRRALAALCFDELAEIERQGKDRYGRTVARVACRGEDVGRAQLRQGLAWVYERYARDPALYALQQSAREQQLGLWADAAAEPPWLWRKACKPRSR